VADQSRKGRISPSASRSERVLTAPRLRTWLDAVVAAAALVVVIGASTVIEAAVAGLYAVGIVTGGRVPAVVISLPNAVSAVYLA
jgi:hypothetical protein